MEDQRASKIRIEGEKNGAVKFMFNSYVSVL